MSVYGPPLKAKETDHGSFFKKGLKLFTKTTTTNRKRKLMSEFPGAKNIFQVTTHAEFNRTLKAAEKREGGKFNVSFDHQPYYQTCRRQKKKKKIVSLARH